MQLLCRWSWLYGGSGGVPTRWRTALLLLLLVGIFYSLQFSTLAPALLWTGTSPYPKPVGYLVYSRRCHIPAYRVWDGSLEKVLAAETPISECATHKKLPQLVQQLPGGVIQLVRDNVTLTEQLLNCRIDCCLQPVVRTAKDSGGIDKNTATICFSEFFSRLRSPHEFLRLQCRCNGNTEVLYEDYFANIVKKLEVEARVANSKLKSNPEALSVYLIAIDSVSQLNFQRFMPRTRRLLEDQMGAVPLRGLTKVGLNTFPNLIPMLTGKTAYKDFAKNHLKHTFDNIGLIWREFADIGYRTMYSEDGPDMSTFNYNKLGFNSSPTDYYARPVFSVMAKSRLKRNYCVNNRLEATFAMDWLREFMTQFAGEPEFALSFASTLSHEGPLRYIEMLDPVYEQFFQWYRQSERYNTSMVMFFSDHGMRFGNAMRLELGRFESRTPFFYVLVPPWYEHVFPERVAALRANADRLSTNYDAYMTMQQILHDIEPARSPPEFQYGNSLFSPLPEDRSCKDAIVDPQWCVCGERRPLDHYDVDRLTQAAQLAVDHINEVKLAAVRSRCAHLVLTNLTQVFNQTSPDRSILVKDVGRVSGPPEQEYVLELETMPGGAVFETTMRVAEDDHWRVLDVSRLNVYGNQSACLDGYFDERRFCLCL